MTKHLGSLGTLTARITGPAGVSLYSRYVNRPLAGILARRLASRVSPNQMSLVSAMFSVAGIMLLAVVRTSWVVGLLVWLLLAVGFVLDSADGQIARLRGASSTAGEWLDHVLDAVRTVAVHGAVLVAWFRYFGLPQWRLLIPLVFILVATTLFMGGTLALILGRAGHVSTGSGKWSGLSLRSLILLPADFGVLSAAFVVLGDRQLFVNIYTGLLMWNIALLGVLCVKWFRELTRLATAT